MDLIRQGGSDATPEYLKAALFTARNALSNVSDIPTQAAQSFSLGPANNFITRQAYGGDNIVRGALIGTGDIPVPTGRAPVPNFPAPAGSTPGGFRGSSPAEIISETPTRGQVIPVSMPRSVRSSAAQSPAPVPEFGPRPVAPTAFESVAQELNRQKNQAAAVAELQKRGPVAVRPTGTMTNTVQGRLGLRNSPGSVALDETISSRGNTIPVGTRTGGQFFNPATSTTPETKQFLRQMTDQAQPGYGPAMDPRLSPGQGIVFRGGALAIPESIAPSSPARLKVGRSLPIDYPQTDVVMRARRSAPYNAAARRYIDPASFVRNSVIPTNEGSFLTDLSDPRILAALGVGGATAAGLGVGFGLNALTQGQMPMSNPTDGGLPTTELEKIVRLVEEEKGTVTGVTDIASSIQRELETSPEPVVKTDQPTSVISNDGNKERRRELEQQSGDINAIINKYTEPMSPEKYSNIADYYRDRDNYASQDSRRELIAAAVSELAGLQSENMRTWAETHPGLAYQLLERQGLNAPEMSQQTISSVPGVTAVSELGSNPEDSALTAANGIENPDLNEVTRPRTQQELNPLPLPLQRLLSARGIG